MIIKNSKNLSISKIGEVLAQDKFEFVKTKIGGKEYNYIKGKHKFSISKSFNSVKLIMTPRKKIVLILVSIPFMVLTAVFSWFVLRFISTIVLAIGGIIGIALFTVLYSLIYKKDLISEKNIIEKIINN